MQRQEDPEQINPWTVRGKRSLKDKQKHLSTCNKKSIVNTLLPQHQTIQNIVRPTMPAQIEKVVQLSLARHTIALRPNQEISDERVKELDKVLNQELYSKFLPSYKLIDISFASKGKTSSKPRKIPYYIKSLRQYTDQSQLKRKETKHSSSKPIANLRFFTEEKDSDQWFLKKELRKSIDIHRNYQRKIISSEKDPVMIIHQRKKANSIELRLKSKEFQDKWSHIWETGGTLANRLSQMKKYYNICKIKRL